MACSRAQDLICLLPVAAEGFVRGGAVLSGVLVSETRPLGVVAGFDGG